MNTVFAALMLAVLPLFPDETVGTLSIVRQANPIYSPLTIQHGDIVVAGSEEDLQALVAGETTQLTDEWK